MQTEATESDRLQTELEKLFIRQGQILGKLNTLSASSGESGTWIDVGMEREYYRDFPLDETEMPDFRERFLKLVDGLDEKSVQTVVRALNRLRTIRNSTDRLMKLYTAEEAEALRQTREALSKEVIRLSGGCWFYGGWMLPSSVFDPSVFMDRCGLRHLKHPERFADRDIVDAGAFIGDSALIFSPCTSRGVYAFEPSSENYAKLEKTVAMNNLGNVVPCQLALGEKRDRVSLSRSFVASAHTQVPKDRVPYAGSETVQSTTLDEFVGEHGLEVGLIKADVEGAEQMLIRGAEETIRTMKPSLLISIYHNAGDFFDIKPYLETLNPGYRFRIRHPAIGTILTETMLIAEDRGEEGTS